LPATGCRKQVRPPINIIAACFESPEFDPKRKVNKWYRCDNCRKKEKIWNSRPRVVPFTVKCDNCDNGIMRHINWNIDEYAPDHTPEKGDRIFVDLSREAADIVFKNKIKSCWDDKPYSLSEEFESKEKALEYFRRTWKFGAPAIETV